MTKTNWDKYYRGLRRDPRTKAELEKAGWAIEIAMQISRLRKDRGLTQKQLASLISVPQPSIARLERIDYKGYSLRTLEKIAKALSQDIKVTFVPRDQEIGYEPCIYSDYLSGQLYASSRISFHSSLGTAVEVWDQPVIKSAIDGKPVENLGRVKTDFGLLKTQEKTFNLGGLAL